MSRYPLSTLVPRPDEPLKGEVVFGERPGDSAVALLDLISFVMDRLVPVPGTRLRVGLNSLLLILPLLGDVLASLVSITILLVGLSSYRVPRIVAVRMVLNTLLDTSLGWIPVVGDLFDLFFKADTRNVRLLQEHLGRAGPPRPAWRHWVFVLGLLAAFALLLALIVFGLIALVHLVAQAVRGH